MTFDFSDKVCVVTGGANGIGGCLVEAFVSSGSVVAFIDTDGDSGRRLEGANKKGDLFFMEGDIADEATLVRFADQVLYRYHGVDFLINNACVSRKGILSGCSYDDFLYVQKLGVAAPYLLAKLFRDSFRVGASIVNISSTRALMSQEDTESYSAAKGGIEALTHALSVSLASRVRVNAVSPGWIDTTAYQGNGGSATAHSYADEKQHPAGRVGVPQDIAAMAMFLCSDEASFITGQNFVVDGGMTKLMIYNDDKGWQYTP